MRGGRFDFRGNEGLIGDQVPSPDGPGEASCSPWQEGKGRVSSILTREDMVEQVDCVVIGAGVVGLAVARALASRGRE
ncbi:MAG: hypothetical protein FD153_1006, partial [Rhodospirillaceae bacterium]